MFIRLVIAFAIVVYRQIHPDRPDLPDFGQTTIAVYIIGIADLYTSRAKTKAMIELFNELTVVSVLYTDICMSDFVPDEETKVLQVSNFTCTIVSLHLVGSISLTMRTSIFEARRSRRLKKALVKLQIERQVNKVCLIKANRVRKSEEISERRPSNCNKRTH